MSPQPADTAPPEELTSQAYHITVDDGRDSFCALSIESPDVETAWLISDTVRSLESMR
ncbi:MULTISPECIES: hypothetical protein [Haloarcula]|uniref:Uncharacterized protein n=1 Tax=Haloarcula pellucida TaxID=1427151 RepID=A0A830GGW7_9EURY|nr:MULTISPECIES: hypothetical protein [Halomicroarcula]MBX0346852.1 hypothetical protein [Halomicroarcula pellucida]MDS0277274.1 hypothetical protein [Halomicroarcula sp. S1AR25-4]GGN85788.1 hypothetical protein GCM10009030_02720 [Halomicroarcula pellucida]